MSESRPTRSAMAVCPRCGVRYDGAARYCQRDGAYLVRADSEPDPYLGRELLGQFRLEEVIGAGGMGTVYRARQPSLDRDVAIKILHADVAGNPDAVRRFQREARVATALDHPNVVRVLLLGQLDDGALYLVMEHLSGRPLGDLVREGPMPLQRALHIALQVCDGVGEAHAHGVVHRDVKPENVMVVRRGSEPDFVKVLDFGIARLLWDDQTVATQSGVIFGTARYISPEGASGEPTDARSDVYSIAVVFYQLLTGQTPFDGATPVTLLLKHVNEPAPDIRDKTRVPDPIADVIMRALHKDPSARFADGGAFGQALREAAARAGVGVRPVGGMSMGASWAPPVVASHPPSMGAPAGSRHGNTLANAPSPFVEETAAGAPRPAGVRDGARLGLVATVMLAFFLGAGAVTAGAVLVAWLVRTSPPASPVAGSAPASPSAAPVGAGAAVQPPQRAHAERRAEASSLSTNAGTTAPRASAAAGAERLQQVSAERPHSEPAPRPAQHRRRQDPVTTIGPGHSSEPAPVVLAPAVQEGGGAAVPESPAPPAPPASPPSTASSGTASPGTAPSSAAPSSAASSGTAPSSAASSGTASSGTAPSAAKRPASAPPPAASSPPSAQPPSGSPPASTSPAVKPPVPQKPGASPPAGAAPAPSQPPAQKPPDVDSPSNEPPPPWTGPGTVL